MNKTKRIGYLASHPLGVKPGASNEPFERIEHIQRNSFGEIKLLRLFPNWVEWIGPNWGMRFSSNEKLVEARLLDIKGCQPAKGSERYFVEPRHAVLLVDKLFGEWSIRPDNIIGIYKIILLNAYYDDK